MHYEIAQFLIALGAITEMLGANYQIIIANYPATRGCNERAGGWYFYVNYFFFSRWQLQGGKNMLISVLKVGCFLKLFFYLLT